MPTCCCPREGGGEDCFHVDDCGRCHTHDPENCVCTQDSPGPCAGTKAIEAVVARPYGDNPEVVAAVSTVYESVFDVRRLLETSDLGRRVLEYNAVFVEEAGRIIDENPELGRHIFQVLMKAVSFGRAMERERVEPGSTAPGHRFDAEDYRFGAEVADEIRNVTSNEALLSTIDDLQQEAERFVGLSPTEALRVFYGRA